MTSTSQATSEARGPEHARADGTTIRRILVPHDFDPQADAAFRYALILAAPLAARITLLHAFEDPTERCDDVGDRIFESMPALVEPARKATIAKLEVIAVRGRSRGVDVTVAARCGRPWCEIDAEATEGQYDLIVMGTHGRRGLSHVLIGSVAEHVVRTAPCPVLTVRENGMVPRSRDA
jgi:universal stress protein A